ncbi:MAG: hypothetical protein WBE09_09710, partial [Candidatus Acidiferrales bacterium]
LFLGASAGARLYLGVLTRRTGTRKAPKQASAEESGGEPPHSTWFDCRAEPAAGWRRFLAEG